MAPERYGCAVPAATLGATRQRVRRRGAFPYIDVATIHLPDTNVDDRLNARPAVYAVNTPEKQQFIAFAD